MSILNTGTLTGLAAATDYVLDAVHVDAWGNVSSVVSSAPFTTAASTAFTDDFNRADGALEASPNWREVRATAGSADIASNRLEIGAGAGFGDYMAMCEAALADNHYVEAEIVAKPAGGYDETAVCARVSDGGGGSWSGYMFRLTSAGTINLIRVDGAAKTDLTSASLTITPGDVLRIECQGATVRGLVNGVTQASITDATHASGKAGLYRVVDNNTAIFDNFEAGDL